MKKKKYTIRPKYKKRSASATEGGREMKFKVVKYSKIKDEERDGYVGTEGYVLIDTSVTIDDNLLTLPGSCTPVLFKTRELAEQCRKLLLKKNLAFIDKW